MTKNGITAYQIKDLEKDVDGLKSDVTRILNNHLPHLQVALTEVKGELKTLGEKFDEKTRGISDRVAIGVGINVVLIIAGVVGIILLIR